MGYQLTQEQKDFLDFIAAKHLHTFYLTGGTALSNFYLQHRFSEDLDFFSSNNFEITDVTNLIGEAKKGIGFTSFDFQQSFNRNIYQLRFPKDRFLKVEFTYYPFEPIEKPKDYDGLLVDNLLDIAVNKVFTITQQARGRDYYDLFVIFGKTKWKFTDLLKKARIKFDWYIDYLQLGSQLLKVESLLDEPILIDTSITKKKVVDFFKKLSTDFQKEILKK